MEESVELINLSGRKVRVATRRKELLLSQGFTLPGPGEPEPKVAGDDYEPPVIILEDLTKAELWTRIKDAGLDDKVSYTDTKDAMIEAFGGE